MAEGSKIRVHDDNVRKASGITPLSQGFAELFREGGIPQEGRYLVDDRLLRLYLLLKLFEGQVVGFWHIYHLSVI